MQMIFNNALTNVDGLGGITSVGGNLTILGSPLLTNLDGLAALTSVGGDLTIFNNTVLKVNAAFLAAIGKSKVDE